MKRCIIFDPTLSSNAGHNLDANIDFAAFLQNECEIQTEIWAADIFDASTSIGAQITPTIPWIYEYVWQTQSNSAMARLQRMARRVRERATTRRWWWIPSLALNLVSHVSSRHRLSKTIRSALNKNFDVLLFPNADFYSLLFLYELSSMNLIPSNIRIIIRLINVLEHFSYIPNGMYLLAPILRSLNNQSNVIITAETEKYCAYLEKTLVASIPVSVIPRRMDGVTYNLGLSPARNPSKINHATQFVLLCPGGARPDKGYWQFIDIASYLMNIFDGKVVLALQQMPPEHQDFDKLYHDKLVQMPNIILLPCVLSTPEYHAALNDADAILLPYDSYHYQSRGSASMFDAFLFDKPVIATRGTGFGQTIEMYDLGFTYSRVNELQDAIKTIMSWSTEEIAELQNRQKAYIKNRAVELRNILCG